MPRLTVLGVPSSAGSYSAGQEQAPRALREAGLLDALVNAGHEVHDAGDLTVRTWHPDRTNRYAQNVPDIVASLREMVDAVPPLLGGDDRLLVLGGNCLVTLGVCAGMRRVGVEPSLLYLDRHFDLNTPKSTTEGALDWMGVAHALALDDTVAEVVHALGERPLLSADRLSFLGIEPNGPTSWELEQVERLTLPVVSLDELVASPRAAATAARAALPAEPFAVHVDVDVLDFIDAPIAENVNGRNTGPTIEQLGEALAVLWQDPGCRALSIGELNPVHAASDPAALPRFIRMLASALSASTI